MSSIPFGCEWSVYGASVLGRSHRKKNLPNQDAIRWFPGEVAVPPVVMAIADGHGSPKSFRSQIGSAFAVEIALEYLAPQEGKEYEYDNPSALKRMIEEALPKGLSRAWRRQVERYHEAHPFRGEEWESLHENAGIEGVDAVRDNFLLAYGATFLAVLVTDLCVLYLQLGDGDILTVSAEGEVSRPLAADARLIANETTSLCQPNAWRDFRCAFERFEKAPPALILVSTDGYSNSFADEKGFLQASTDIWRMLRNGQEQKVRNELEGWLNEASNFGSGDDVTVGMIFQPPSKTWGEPLFTGSAIAQRPKQTDKTNEGHNPDPTIQPDQSSIVREPQARNPEAEIDPNQQTGRQKIGMFQQISRTMGLWTNRASEPKSILRSEEQTPGMDKTDKNDSDDMR